MTKTPKAKARKVLADGHHANSSQPGELMAVG
jgi:hypothetical protein